jgi:acyl carrier protein
LRGYRIELGEIEAALTEKGGVAEAAASLRDESGTPTLIAYWVDAKAASKTAEELRAILSRDLPPYMIPSIWMRLDRLPRLPNTKLDRAALPPPPSAPAVHAEDALPQTEMEKKVASIWTDVLKHAPILRTDDLLQLGADSIQVFQITARANKAGITLSAKDLFKYRSLADLAAFLAGQRTESNAGHSLNSPHRNSRFAPDFTGIDAEHRFDQPRSSFNPSRTVRKAT